MSFLDEVIANTVGPRVVSEQHDTRKIHTGMTLEGLQARKAAEVERIRQRGAWDEAEYGMTLEDQVARLEAANTPEALQIELDAMIDRAITRADLDTTGGYVSLMVAGETPWHRLGVNVDRATDAATAARLSRLAGWNMSKEPLSFRSADGTWIEVPDRFAVVRGDSGACLGTVGKGYRIIPNEEGFSFLDGLMGEFGARFVTAGSVAGGRQVWMQVELPKQAFTLAGGDVNAAYAMFTNTHDGSAAAQCLTTSERAVCRNTLRVALNQREKAFYMRHTGDIRGKVADARKALGLAVQGLERYRENAEVLSRTPCPSIQDFTHGVLDTVLKVTQAQALMGADALAASLLATEATYEERERLAKTKRREIDQRRDLLEDILTRYERGTNGVGGMRGTAWAAMNAVTEHADHYRGNGRQCGDEITRQERRFESVLVGAADTMKQAAYSAALGLAS